MSSLNARRCPQQQFDACQAQQRSIAVQWLPGARSACVQWQRGCVRVRNPKTYIDVHAMQEWTLGAGSAGCAVYMTPVSAPVSFKSLHRRA